jgi:hypothetical protein
MLVLSRTKSIDYFNSEIIRLIKEHDSLLMINEVYPIDKKIPITTNTSYMFSDCYKIYYVDENLITLNVVFKNSIKDKINIKPSELKDYIGEDKIRDIYVYLHEKYEKY